jgi:acyl-CoA hydrolase
MPSTTSRGESRIVPFLKQGAGVVTTRAHVHYIVTEHGTAYLHGRSLRERARALIAIAAPEHREMLERAMCEQFHCL